ncbi:hypothetical protein H5P28_02155 [Ruficoccus amylovorans]|uniref:Uncharacterized protein n=1 Tax=Ruficoccus amylovorans TaxID=1804625 RepID=A0A842HBW2_9BACT|nr:hypothetical protein [Ruficoccus amylovorans]MBC2593054.1 hypothetical protein [Ruficoccus amylovorans]
MIKRQHLREVILLQLEAAAPAFLPVDTLRTGIRHAGHEITDRILRRELAYLDDKKLIDSALPDLDPADKRYRLAAQGQDFLDANGLSES